MRSIKIPLILLALFTFNSFATTNEFTNPYHFGVNFTGYFTSTAGNNDYGLAAGNNDYGLATSNNTTTLLSPQKKAKFTYSLVITYLKNHDTWDLSYQQFEPAWQTNSVDNADGFNGQLYYSGKDDLTQFKLEHGSLFAVTPTLLLNFHTGLSYVDEKSNRDLTGNYTGSNSTFHHSQTHFSGIGPVIGITFIRQLNHDFDFSNTANVGLLYGDYQADSNNINSSGTIATIQTAPKHSIIVPQFDINFAMGFHHKLSDKALFQTRLGIQFQQLFNVTNTQDASLPNNQNVAFYGPFLQIGFLF
jgi:hypothetical protein